MRKTKDQKREEWRARYAKQRMDQGQPYEPYKPTHPLKPLWRKPMLTKPMSVRLEATSLATCHLFFTQNNHQVGLENPSALVREVVKTLALTIARRLPDTPAFSPQEATTYLEQQLGASIFQQAPAQDTAHLDVILTPDPTCAPDPELPQPYPRPIQHPENYIWRLLPSDWKQIITDQIPMTEAQHATFHALMIDRISAYSDRQKEEEQLDKEHAYYNSQLELNRQRNEEAARVREKLALKAPAPYIVEYRLALNLRQLKIVAKVSSVTAEALKNQDQLALRACAVILPQMTESIVGTPKGEEVIASTISEWQEWMSTHPDAPPVPNYYTFEKEI